MRRILVCARFTLMKQVFSLGREAQVDALLEKLDHCRFLAVLSTWTEIS
jgi:hypothetical protein